MRWIIGHGLHHRSKRYDPIGKLLYLRLEGEGFVMPFAEWESVAEWPMFAANDDWQEVTLEHPARVDDRREHPLWQPVYVFELGADAPTGSPIMNSDGQLIGFAGQNAIIPAWLIGNQLGVVLEKGRSNIAACHLSDRW